MNETSGELLRFSPAKAHKVLRVAFFQPLQRHVHWIVAYLAPGRCRKSEVLAHYFFPSFSRSESTCGEKNDNSHLFILHRTMKSEPLPANQPERIYSICTQYKYDGTKPSFTTLSPPTREPDRPVCSYSKERKVWLLPPSSPPLNVFVASRPRPPARPPPVVVIALW